ncbi:tafazzin [Ophiostoma piceae UAMH 11346]|uniref:Tafazzin family protein n=1 Tax=Ophiostoma piceae (strain UAMH 11346) TaxID=1262450 RepID=S3CAU7_OPHP1|nr:tafazzin [Ophiostoma piceae UAMH 11346]
MVAGKVQPRPVGRVYGRVSTLVMATTGLICRTFLCGLNSVEVVGRDNFLKLLDSRKDVAARQRGLLTLSNHISVLDDPMVWGVLPFNTIGRFFFTGQTLPTHRLRHSPWGGLFQPVLNEAVRLLSAQPPAVSYKVLASTESLVPSSKLTSSSSSSTQVPEQSPPTPSTTLPVTAAASPPTPAFFSTNNVDRWSSPSSFDDNRHAWVHIFPEGMVHQHNDRALRYFKWGVARLILESEPAPDVVPMFIDGLDRIMHEERKFPRFIPRIGQRVRIVFGNTVAPEKFADLRQRWQQLVAEAKASKTTRKASQGEGAVLDLKYGPEAQKIRSETALRMREEILQLRRESGFPDEDLSKGLSLPDTWANEPNKKRYRSQVDDSMVYEE